MPWHDDGVLYARLLQKAGVEAELHESRGTMHGFDTKFHAPTSQTMIAKRIAYMQRKFHQESRHADGLNPEEPNYP